MNRKANATRRHVIAFSRRYVIRLENAPTRRLVAFAFLFIQVRSTAVSSSYNAWNLPGQPCSETHCIIFYQTKQITQKLELNMNDLYIIFPRMFLFPSLPRRDFP